jgi:hypothetical protein
MQALSGTTSHIFLYMILKNLSKSTPECTRTPKSLGSVAFVMLDRIGDIHDKLNAFGSLVTSALCLFSNPTIAWLQGVVRISDHVFSGPSRKDHISW